LVDGRDSRFKLSIVSGWVRSVAAALVLVVIATGIMSARPSVARARWSDPVALFDGPDIDPADVVVPDVIDLPQPAVVAIHDLGREVIVEPVPARIPVYSQAPKTSPPAWS
jgi:hypothetical protein